MERASSNYAFVRRELRLHSNAHAKIRTRLVVIFSSVREELKTVLTGSD